MQIYKVRPRIRGFKPVAKLLLGDDLQNPKLDEETAQQILSLLWSSKPLDQGIPLPPPPRGLMPPTKRVLQARSTEHLMEALKEVMLELEPTAPTMKKYRKSLQKQNIDDNDITTTRM